MNCRTREELETRIADYLLFCYRGRSAARAGELSSFLMIDRHALSRLAKRLFNLTPKAVLTNMQLVLAARLLRDPTIAIDEVAARAGFGVRRSFDRAFKNRFSCSPEAFRQA